MKQDRLGEKRPSQIAEALTQELKNDQSVTRTWIRLGPDNITRVFFRKGASEAGMFVIEPDCRTSPLINGVIDFERDDRGHPEEVTKFVYQGGEPIIIDRMPL